MMKPGIRLVLNVLKIAHQSFMQEDLNLVVKNLDTHEN